MNKKGEWWMSLILIVVFIMLVTAVKLVFYLATESTTDMCIEEKYMKRTGGNSDTFFLRTTQYGYIDSPTEIYKLKDTIIPYNKNTADDYFLLKEGQCYHVDYYGARVPLFSWFKNIYRFQIIK